MTSQSTIDSTIHVPNPRTLSVQSAEGVAIDQPRSRLIEAMRSQYQLDQQVKFLHLQAEADSLLQQLQSLKQQRQATKASSLRQ